MFNFILYPPFYDQELPAVLSDESKRFIIADFLRDPETTMVYYKWYEGGGHLKEFAEGYNPIDWMVKPSGSIHFETKFGIYIGDGYLGTIPYNPNEYEYDSGFKINPANPTKKELIIKAIYSPNLTSDIIFSIPILIKPDSLISHPISLLPRPGTPVGLYKEELVFLTDDEIEYKVLIDYEVTKIDPELTLEMPNYIYGEPRPDPVLTGNNENGAVKYYYSVEDGWREGFPTDAGNYNLRADVEETDNYNAASVKTTFDIEKALATPEPLPNQEGYVDDKLSSIELPEGWVWEGADTVLPVPGEYEFLATYTPEDTKNYLPITQPVTVLVKEKYAINTSVDGGNGTIVGTPEVYEGESATIVVTPEIGFEIDTLIVNGVDMAQKVVGDTLEIPNVTEIKNVVVRFKSKQFNVNVTPPTGSSTNSPETSIVNYGETVVIEYTLEDLYKITLILVNGEEKLASLVENKLTLENITEDITVVTTTEKGNPETVLLVVNGVTGVTTSPTGSSSVPFDSSHELEITLDSGYTLISVKVNDVERIDDVVSGKLPLNNLTEDTFVVIEVKEPYKLVEGNGQTFVINNSESVIFKVNYGLTSLSKVLVNDEEVDPANYTITGDNVIVFTKEYVKKLSEGEQTLKLLFNNNEEVSGIFNVKDLQIKVPPTNVEIISNNKNNNQLLLIISIIISSLGLFILSINNKKKVYKKVKLD